MTLSTIRLHVNGHSFLYTLHNNDLIAAMTITERDTIITVMKGTETIPTKVVEWDADED